MRGVETQQAYYFLSQFLINQKRTEITQTKINTFAFVLTLKRPVWNVLTKGCFKDSLKFLFICYVHAVFNTASLLWPKQDYFEGSLAMPHVFLWTQPRVYIGKLVSNQVQLTRPNLNWTQMSVQKKQHVSVFSERAFGNKFIVNSVDNGMEGWTFSFTKFWLYDWYCW